MLQKESGDVVNDAKMTLSPMQKWYFKPYKTAFCDAEMTFLTYVESLLNQSILTSLTTLEWGF